MEIQKLLKDKRVINRLPTYILPVLDLLPHGTETIPGLFEVIHQQGDAKAKNGLLYWIIDGISLAIVPEFQDESEFCTEFAGEIVDHAKFLYNYYPDRGTEIDRRVKNWITALRSRDDNDGITDLTNIERNWKVTLHPEQIPELR